MKSYFTILFLIVIFSLNVLADPISVQTASQVGQSFMARTVTATGMLKTKKLQASLTLVYKADSLQVDAINNTVKTFVPYYVFSPDNHGYVIVSGDDRVIPILGFADDGIFDPNNIPPNMQKWLEGYKSEIRYAIENNIAASSEILAQWKTLQSGVSLKSQTLASSVAPLITTKWNQSPYYNDLCPYDNTQNERTVTGCVATAMAQVMKYWNYPAISTGFHSYNHSKFGTLSANFGSTSYQWGSMPNTVSSTNNAVATLMYHCGISVDMNYGVAETGGSGAYVISSANPVTHCTEYALKTYFGYKSTLQGIKKINYTNSNWINLLKTELDAGRPMVYAGFGDGGHCFVCDGYDNNNYFHFNWGWGGSYDGYFALNALNPGIGGIGGGSYSYNDGQQAVIGIEPANGVTTPQNFDLRLYSDLNMSSTKVWFRSAFDLKVDIANYGTGSYTGKFGAAVFDKDGNFVDFMEIKSDMTLNVSSHYTNGLTFINSGSASFVPGTYYAAIFYKTTTQDWTIVANGNYTNLKLFEIVYSSDIEVNSSFTITGGTLIQGQSATVNVDVFNTGSNTFYGKYRVNLANLDGSWAQNIQILDENNGLPSNYHYTGGNSFTGTITVTPGTYLMEVAYQTKGSSSWYYGGSTNYLNPVYVIVKSPEILSDIYEDNNTQTQAYNLPITYSGKSSAPNTNGSNLHIGTDIDYFKIVLPSGYNYDITPRLNDNYNSGNGKTYTVDALFSYSTNRTTYSETYDDVMSGNITVNNGGTVYFKVAPYFSGNIGTYQLDLNITRSAITSPNDVEINTQISIYPNPADNFVSIDFLESSHKINQIVLCDIKGNQLYIVKVEKSKGTIRLPLKGFSNGVYFVQIYSDYGILTKKLVVEK